ncbi:MAG: hypothetical protein H6985_17715 [Pseudomonadales bacterium]|nr:hypothetical protein [Halioglobus sp.]MCP5131405.1 hypothetical protein [Pseudomonadales bacterium]
MDQPTITFFLNGKTYSLRPGDTAAIGAIPSEDRQVLLALLESVKQQEDLAMAVARRAVDKARGASHGVTAPPGPRPAAGERLGSGDVDALMARLVMEENRNRKPALTRQGMYKWVLGSAAIIILLLLLF